ncbi:MULTISPECIES: hypothetical protein [Streptomyces]|uniref:hypothetical protein n=1 Tax=Streptomyces TaxID=1883 RepID=UPI0004BE66CA|nr:MULTISPECIES: hypothetical protein [Streptomyces]KOT59747.1 hypothetical protein ADK43_15950 [Streptomyces rimosus subsp. rimosus]KOT77956.1 hypothetical protein ADK70_35865 [Streptomyces rimosus subsp. pseudoverticillatus]RSO13779.1 hypothetical protein DMH18_02250 [Streptomyces sp. WAC 06783]RSO29937.1 hypothetical protein DMH15_26715 [Streptomyces sp. WAC 06725]
MKQGTTKTLGAAVLGVAFAATAAGTAAAATPAATVPAADVAGALQAVQNLPVEKTAKGITDHGSDHSLKANNKGNLLGGLPAGGVTKALPALG